MFAGFTSRWTSPRRVGGVEARGHLRDQIGRKLRVPAGRGLMKLRVCALHIIHRDEEQVPLPPGAVDRDDVGVPDRRRLPGLALEPRAEVGLRRELRGDQLERHDTVESEITRAVDDPLMLPRPMISSNR